MFAQTQISSGRKCVLLTCISMLGLIFILAVHAEPTQVPQQVREKQIAAKSCIKINDYAGARSSHEAIIQSFPNTEYAMHAQAEIVRLFAQEEDDVSANAARNVLYSKYASQPDLFKAIDRAIRIYRKQKEYDKAIACYIEGLANFPEHPHRIRFKQWIIEGYLLKQDIAEADRLLSEFWTNNSEGPLFPNAARHIGWFYRQADQSEKAIQIYKRALSEFPEDQERIQLQKALVCTYIDQGDLSPAEQELEMFWSAYKAQDDFIKCVRTIKGRYWTTDKPQKSRALCRRLLAEFPKHKDVPLLYKDLVHGYLKTNQFVEAEAAVEEMFVNDPNSPRIVEAGRSIAYAFRRKKDSGKALSIYSRLLKKHPEHADAIHIQKAMIYCYLELGAGDKTEEPVRIFSEKYQAHPAYHRIVNSMAWQFRQKKHYTKSIELNQEVLTHNPSDEEKLNAYASMAKAMVHVIPAGMDPNAPAENREAIEMIVQRLMTDHSDAKRLGFHIFQIGEEYYFRAEEAAKKGQEGQSAAHFQKALSIWQKNIDQIADPHHKCLAVYYSGAVCQMNGDYETAITHYQTVVDQWPEYEKAWYAQFMIAKCTEKLVQQKGASATDVRSAYQRLIEKYPDCSAAATAHKKLNIL